MGGHISASGERAAIVGYKGQYRVAAEWIYQALIDGQLEWIALTDPEAGRLDDLVLALKNVIHAFQVKWSDHADTITFNQLITGSGDLNEEDIGNIKTAGLIGQLSGGWLRLKDKYPEKQIKVHLVTRDIPSPSGDIPTNGKTVSKSNLHGFITDCLSDKSWIEHDISSCPVPWQTAMKSLQTATGLEDKQFIDFLLSCELDLGYQIESNKILSSSPERLEDINFIEKFLFGLIGDDKRTITLDKETLLDKLGWTPRFISKFFHEFPVDELYQPIDKTIKELEECVAKTYQGYLAVIGTPGSGKSTSLTHTLRYKTGCTIIRYYAYVPDHPLQGRGESFSFLHDIVLALRGTGVNSGGMQAKTREDLLNQFSLQLEQLHQQWINKKVKTLIFIDGLDHIEREQTPERSLLLDLPLPNSIPEGVVFILGSQTLNLSGLSVAIKSHIEKENRIITMSPMGYHSVLKAIEVAQFSTPISPEQKNKIYELSQGHPLALSYIIKSVREIKSMEEIDLVLDNTSQYQDHIDDIYTIYWASLEANEKLQELLALLARLRVSFNPLILEKWRDVSTLKALIEKAHFYFFKESKHSWRFFHNSFRQFIIQKTSVNLLGEKDPLKNKNYHTEIASLVKTIQVGNVLKWEELYHLACAEQWEDVIQLGSQDYFRNQFYELRPLIQIKEDITLVLKAIQKTANPEKLLSLLLIEHELNERDRALEEINISKLYLNSSNNEGLISYVTDGGTGELAIDKEDALEICLDLIKIGELDLARKFFELSEPLEYLSGTEVLEMHNYNLIKLWLKNAHYFRSIEEIKRRIEALRLNQEDSDLHHNFYTTFAKAIAQTEDGGKWKAFKDSVANITNKEEVLAVFDLHICSNFPEHIDAKNALNRFLSWLQHEEKELNNEDKVHIASLILKIDNNLEQAKNWVENIPQPPIHDWTGNSDNSLKPLDSKIQLNKMRAILGMPLPDSSIAISKDDRNYGTILFENTLMIIIAVWNEAKQGNILTAQEVLRRLKPCLLLFNKSWQETRDWTSWYSLQQRRVSYFEFMIDAVALHGKECIYALNDFFEKQWEGDETSKYWPIDVRLAITMTLYKYGCTKSKTLDDVSCIEEQIGLTSELYERIEVYEELIIAYQKLGEIDRANSAIKKMLINSFAIYHDKDDQFSRWVDVLCKLNCVESDDLCKFVAVAKVLHQQNRGRDNDWAITNLIALAMCKNFEDAQTISKWLLENNGGTFVDITQGLILGALKTKEPPTDLIFSIVNYLLIPLEGYVKSSFYESLARFTSLICETKKAESLLNETIHHISIKAWPENRGNYFQALKDGGKAANKNIELIHITSKDVNQSDSNQYSDYNKKLKLVDGSELTLDEVKQQLSSYNELVRMINKAENAEKFSWLDALSPSLITSLSKDEILHTYTLINFGLTIFSEKGKLFFKQLKALASSGSIEQILTDLLMKGRSGGWDIRYDGGTRISPLKELIKLNPKKWRNDGLSLFIDDYINGYRYPESILRQIEEVFSVFFDAIPWDVLWKDLKEHIYQLADFSQVTEMPQLEQNQQNYTCQKNLLLHVVWAWSLPINEVKGYAHSALINIAISQKAEADLKNVLINHFGKGEKEKIQVLALLEDVYRRNYKLADFFNFEIREALNSPNIVIRKMAASLAKLMKLETHKIVIKNKRLPLIYDMEFPKMESLEQGIPSTSIRATDPLPEFGDIINLVRPHDLVLEFMAKHSEIPLANIVHRVVSLMEEIEPKEMWDSGAQHLLLEKLRSLDLEFTYNRLRPIVALYAISHAAVELHDAGLLDDDKIDVIYFSLCLHDWRLSKEWPNKRPPEFPLLQQNEKNHYSRNNDWLKEINIDLSYCIDQLENNSSILGMLAEIREWGWDTPKEQRFLQVCSKDFLFDHSNEYQFFACLNYWQARNYPSFPWIEDEQTLIVYGNTLQTLFGKAQWLAFNPYIASRLGWKFSDQGLFRWVDDSGNVMVESVWWQDGPIDRHPPKLNEITSTGWFVVASPKAKSVIYELLPNLEIRRCIKRSLQREDHKDYQFGESFSRGSWL